MKNGPFYFIKGNPESNDAIPMLKEIPTNCHIMGASEEWIKKLREIYNEKLLSYSRYILSSEALTINKIQETIDSSIYREKIKRITLDIAKEIHLDRIHSYHLINFNSPEDFFNCGIGYYFKEDSKFIGIASSALVYSKGIEIDIMVIPEYRKKNIGKTLASYLIKYCLENKIDPHWNAGSEISLKLAESLNYKFMKKYLAYYFKSA